MALGSPQVAPGGEVVGDEPRLLDTPFRQLGIGDSSGGVIQGVVERLSVADQEQLHAVAVVA